MTLATGDASGFFDLPTLSELAQATDAFESLLGEKDSNKPTLYNSSVVQTRTLVTPKTPPPTAQAHVQQHNPRQQRQTGDTLWEKQRNGLELNKPCARTQKAEKKVKQ